MVCTYEEYLKQPKAITFGKMQIFHAEMLAEIGSDVETLELYDELMKVATRYAAIRANWLLLSREEKSEQDSGRTSCHNSVITHFNMLARYLKQQGKTAAWRDELGYEEDDPYDRKAIGDFACYLAFVNGINAGQLIDRRIKIGGLFICLSTFRLAQSYDEMEISFKVL